MSTPNTLVSAAANIRSEMVFLPPGLLGYIAHSESSTAGFLATGLLVVCATVVHDFVDSVRQIQDEGLSEGGAVIRRPGVESREDDPDAKFIVDQPILGYLFTAGVIYVLSAVATSLYSVYIFHQSQDLYIGIGLFLYLILFVKILRPLKRYEEHEA